MAADPPARLALPGMPTEREGAELMRADEQQVTQKEERAYRAELVSDLLAYKAIKAAADHLGVDVEALTRWLSEPAGGVPRLAAMMEFVARMARQEPGVGPPMPDFEDDGNMDCDVCEGTQRAARSLLRGLSEGARDDA